MLQFLTRRILRALVALWGIVTIVFIVMRLSGDPVPLMLPPDAPTAEMNRVRAELGLDQPIPIQYLVFIGQRAARRPRPLDPHATAGHRHRAGAAAGHIRAGVGRVRAGDRGGAASRLDLGGEAQLDLGQPGDVPRADRAVRADVLHRDHADPGAWAPARAGSRSQAEDRAAGSTCKIGPPCCGTSSCRPSRWGRSRWRASRG